MKQMILMHIIRIWGLIHIVAKMDIMDRFKMILNNKKLAGLKCRYGGIEEC